MMRFTSSMWHRAAGQENRYGWPFAVTGSEYILKFEEIITAMPMPFLVRAGSGVATLGLPDSPGVPAMFVVSSRSAPTTTSEKAVRRIAQLPLARDPARAGGESNGGFIEPGLYPGLRRIADRKRAPCSVFDGESVTGFRRLRWSAQAIRHCFVPFIRFRLFNRFSHLS
jgi:glutamate-1-semialdehyde 2,1-aminomutase